MGRGRAGGRGNGANYSRSNDTSVDASALLMGSPMTGIPGTHPMAGAMMPTAGLNLGTLGGLAMGTLGSQMYNIRATPQQLQYIQQQLATQQATNTAKDVANQQKQIADTVSKALVDAGIVKKEEEPDKPDKPPPRTSPRKKNVAFAEEEPETHEEEEEEPEQPISKSKRQREKRLAARDTLMTRVETLAEENKKLKAYKTFIEDGNPTTRDGYASDGEVDGKTRSKSIMQLIEGANSFANLDSPAKKCLEHLELLNRGKGDKPTGAASQQGPKKASDTDDGISEMDTASDKSSTRLSLADIKRAAQRTKTTKKKASKKRLSGKKLSEYVLKELDAYLDSCDQVSWSGLGDVPEDYLDAESDLTSLAEGIIKAITTVKAGGTALEGLCDKHDIRKARRTSDLKQMQKIVWYLLVNDVDPTEDVAFMHNIGC